MEHEQLEQRGRVQRRPTPRPAGVGGPAASVLGMQQSAGNAAVSSMFRVQRAPLDEDLERWQGGEDVPADGAVPDGGALANGERESGSGSSGEGAATPEAAGVPRDAAGGADAAAGGGGVNELGAVAHVGTLIADSIVASSYTPGAGNIW